MTVTKNYPKILILRICPRNRDLNQLALTKFHPLFLSRPCCLCNPVDRRKDGPVQRTSVYPTFQNTGTAQADNLWPKAFDVQRVIRDLRQSRLTCEELDFSDLLPRIIHHHKLVLGAGIQSPRAGNVGISVRRYDIHENSSSVRGRPVREKLRNFAERGVSVRNCTLSEHPIQPKHERTFSLAR